MKLDLPPPRDRQPFEDLCRDLWAELWRDSNAQKHGRSGQPEGLAPVVLIDELDHLPGRFDPRFFERLRNLLGTVVLVVASRREVDTSTASRAAPRPSTTGCVWYASGSSTRRRLAS